MKASSRRKALRHADQVYDEHDGTDDDPDLIYLNGSRFCERTEVGHDRLRHEVYERQGWADDEVETHEQDGDLYVQTPERQASKS